MTYFQLLDAVFYKKWLSPSSEVWLFFFPLSCFVWDLCSVHLTKPLNHFPSHIFSLEIQPLQHLTWHTFLVLYD